MAAVGSSGKKKLVLSSIFQNSELEFLEGRQGKKLFFLTSTSSSFVFPHQPPRVNQVFAQWSEVKRSLEMEMV